MHLFDVASYQVRGMLAAFEALGIQTAGLVGAAGLRAASLADPDTRVSERSFLTLWSLAESRSSDGLLSLHAGASVPFGAFELIDYLVGSSPTVADVFAQLSRYSQHCSSGLRYEITPEEGGYLVTMQHPYLFEVAPTSLTEYLWTLIVSRLRSHLGVAFRPTLRLRHAPLGPLDIYQRILGEVRFECPRMELQLSNAQWSCLNPRGDARLTGLLERYADHALAALPNRTDLLEIVRCALVTALRSGEPSIEGVGRTLAVTPRTLQRGLAERGYTFKSVLEELRAELARTYLAEHSLSITDIAFLLGYSEPSAFGRAFRRWTGHTPGSFRDGLRAQSKHAPADHV